MIMVGYWSNTPPIRLVRYSHHSDILTVNIEGIIAMDRAYIDYEKLETLTQREVLYVTKMKKNLKYNIIEDFIYQTPEGLMEVHIQRVEFSKAVKDGEKPWFIMPVSLPMPTGKSPNWFHCLRTIWNQIRTRL